MLSSNGIEGKTLVLTNGIDDTFYRSARNLKGVDVRPVGEASTLDLLNAKTIVLQEGAVEALTEALRPSVKATVSSGSPDIEDAPSQEAPALEADPVAPAEPVIDTPDTDEEPVAPAEPVIEDDASDAPDLEDESDDTQTS